MKKQKIRKAATILTLLLFPIVINYLSPYLIISGAAEGIVSGSFIVFAVLFIASLFTGRAYCGWVCPVAALQESCFEINNKKVRGKFVNKVKYIIWFFWIVVIAVMFFTAGGFKEIRPLYLTETGISVDAPEKYIIYYSVLGLFFLLSVLVGKRAACHSICWMAPFMVIGNRIRQLLKIPSLNLTVQKGRCSGCKVCESKCPMSLEVSSMVSRGSMKNDECIMCGECISACTKKTIGYSIGRPE